MNEHGVQEFFSRPEDCTGCSREVCVQEIPSQAVSHEESRSVPPPCSLPGFDSKGQRQCKKSTSTKLKATRAVWHMAGLSAAAIGVLCIKCWPTAICHTSHPKSRFRQACATRASDQKQTGQRQIRRNLSWLTSPWPIKLSSLKRTVSGKPRLPRPRASAEQTLPGKGFTMHFGVLRRIQVREKD